MTRIELNAAQWRTRTDFYAALLPRLRAPEWVGGNLDALFDSLAGNNALPPPHEVIVRNIDALPGEERSYVRRAEGVFDDARLEFGVDVRLRFV